MNIFLAVLVVEGLKRGGEESLLNVVLGWIVTSPFSPANFYASRLQTTVVVLEIGLAGASVRGTAEGSAEPRLARKPQPWQKIFLVIK